MVRMPIVALVILLASLLAGCGGKEATVQPTNTISNKPPVTADTGIILGVVVDVAITPILGVKITLPREGLDPLTTTSDEHGNFVFGDLAEGTYVLEASKAGYKPIQATANVVAGDPDPPVVKVQLAIDEATRPYYDGPYTFDAFMECGYAGPVVAFAACGFVVGVFDIAGQPSPITDNTQVHYPLARLPDFAQSEFVWDPTQALGNDLDVMYSWEGGCTLLCDYGVSGVSPLVVQANATVLAPMYNATPELYIRIFADDIDASDPAGVGGLGIIVNQKVSVFTTVFYGYQPPPEWRFASGEPVPTPK